MRGPQAGLLVGEPRTRADSAPKESRGDSGRALILPGVAVIRWWAGFASLGAGLIHLAVATGHAAEWWLYGVFFIVLGVVQLAWAVQAMDSPPLPVPRLFAAMNAAVIALWLVSRTIGLPVGPQPWTPEAVGTADIVASALEAVVVVLLVLTVRRPRVHESSALTRPQRGMVAFGAVGVAVATGVALAANPPVLYGHEHDGHAAGVIPHASELDRLG